MLALMPPQPYLAMPVDELSSKVADMKGRISTAQESHDAMLKELQACSTRPAAQGLQHKACSTRPAAHGHKDTREAEAVAVAVVDG